MRNFCILFVMYFWSTLFHAVSLEPFPPPGMSLSEYWGKEHVWRDDRAAFHGEVVRPARTLTMEDAWQIIDVGETPVWDLQNGSSGPERKFSLWLRNCEFNSQGGNLFSGSWIRVTFDGIWGEMSDKFNLSGQAKGTSLQIADARGNTARVRKVMPTVPLTGNEEALDYTLRAVRNGKELETGNYFAVLGFRADYGQVAPVRCPVIYLFCESGDAWNGGRNTFCSRQYCPCDIVVSVL